jgi:mevalonate kinase
MSAINSSFYSRGKLLITAEYLILHGSDGLALPLKRGQKLEYCRTGEAFQGETGSGTKPEGDELEWITIVNGLDKFRARFWGPDYRVVSSTNDAGAEFIRKVLYSARELSGKTIAGVIVSRVEFNLEWGLGSSSSLISNISYLFDIDPFKLHFEVSSGSGYDIACARSDSPLIYRLDIKPGSIPVPVYSNVGFNPPFREMVFFAWTGRKKDSASSVDDFLATKRITEQDLELISDISREMLHVKEILHFERLLGEHDAVLSGILGERPVIETLFRGFPGYVKSLGAWGGDFVMITWKRDVEELFFILKQRGMDVVFHYSDLIN